jgi:flavin reductase (DIM6/NTAB) family NADH-FMN oxidoreductase RutF
MASKAFTVNVPNTKLAAATDFAGIVSGRTVDKFAQAGLTAVKSDLVNAPYVAECPVILECELYKTVDLGAHTMMIGKIIDVKADEGLEGVAPALLDMAKVDPIVYNSGGDYHQVGAAVAKAFSIGKTLK